MRKYFYEITIQVQIIFRKREGLAELGIGTGGQLIVTTGVVRRTRCLAFQTMLWRICRGILYYKQAEDDKIFIDPSSVSILCRSYVADLTISCCDRLEVCL